MKEKSIGNASAVLALLLTLLLTACDKTDVRLRNIYLTARTEKLTPGDTTQMSVRAYPERSNTGFPDAEMEWSSSDTTVMEVDGNGVVTAKKYGETTISVTYGPLVATKRMIVSRVADISDPIFKEYLLSRFDTNKDGVLEGYETSQYIGMDLTEIKKKTLDTISLDGLDYFVNLQTLTMANIRIKDLDLSQLRNLREINMRHCYIERLDLRQNAKIERVICFACKDLKDIDFGNYAEYGRNELRTLDCSGDDLESVDLSRCGKTLWDVDCSSNLRLSNLDLSVDTMLHSCIYTCESTEVTWPTGVDMTEVYTECKTKEFEESNPRTEDE